MLGSVRRCLVLTLLKLQLSAGLLVRGATFAVGTRQGMGGGDLRLEVRDNGGAVLFTLAGFLGDPFRFASRLRQGLSGIPRVP